MQDRYAFDIGDFGKLSLLRHLLGNDEAPTLRLGVLWYATALGSAANDGRFIDYLGLESTQAVSHSVEALRRCDPVIHDTFSRALAGPYSAGPAALAAFRTIQALETLPLLPPTTAFFRNVVPPGPARSGWFQQAQSAVSGAQLVFLDPDNGLAEPGSKNERRASRRHVLLDEIGALIGAGHSVIVYHHLTREAGGHDAQIDRWGKQLKDRLAVPAVMTVRLRPRSPRAYFLLSVERDQPLLKERFVALAGSSWVRRGFMTLHAA